MFLNKSGTKLLSKVNSIIEFVIWKEKQELWFQVIREVIITRANLFNKIQIPQDSLLTENALGFKDLKIHLKYQKIKIIFTNK
jgi:hypothetical protein